MSDHAVPILRTIQASDRTTENFRWLGSSLLIVLDVNLWLSHGASGCLLFSIWVLEALQMDLDLCRGDTDEFITNGDDATGAVKRQENHYDALLSAWHLGLEAKVASELASSQYLKSLGLEFGPPSFVWQACARNPRTTWAQQSCWRICRYTSFYSLPQLLGQR